MTNIPGTAYNVDDFTLGYLECALWASIDEQDQETGEGPPMDEDYSVGDLTLEAIATMIADCHHFQAENAADIDKVEDEGRCGHDFWLTRNGHGTGFWDRGLRDLGDRLSKASTAFGECHLYVGDKGRIHAFCG